MVLRDSVKSEKWKGSDIKMSSVQRPQYSLKTAFGASQLSLLLCFLLLFFFLPFHPGSHLPLPFFIHSTFSSYTYLYYYYYYSFINYLTYIYIYFIYILVCLLYIFFLHEMKRPKGKPRSRRSGSKLKDNDFMDGWV